MTFSLRISSLFIWGMSFLVSVLWLFHVPRSSHFFKSRFINSVIRQKKYRERGERKQRLLTSLPFFSLFILSPASFCYGYHITSHPRLAIPALYRLDLEGQMRVNERRQCISNGKKRNNVFFFFLPFRNDVASQVDCSQFSHWHTGWAVREEEKLTKTKRNCRVRFIMESSTDRQEKRRASRRGGEEKERISRPTP